VFNSLINKKEKLAVIGLGYVGLPVALEFAKKFCVIGFDINSERIRLMQNGIDPSNEIPSSDFTGKDIRFTDLQKELQEARFYIVAVPTPVTKYKVPDLSALLKASTTIGQVLKPGDYVVFESTVYPGCTEEDCVPVLEQISGLKAGVDFKVGYSPERLNPGDKQRPFSSILKLVSGIDEEAAEEIAAVYGAVVSAGVYKTTSIKVAEAAKVIENTQRDLNISLMNELAIIFDRLGIDTQEVIEAAGTKWNFLKFYPGLVGGHCISVDPYYLLHKAKQVGYEPEVIHSGRRINDSMPSFVAKKLVQMLIQKGKSPQNTRVLVMGITFKENVADIRNSKIAELVKELMLFSVQTEIIDPYASASDLRAEFDLELSATPSGKYDAIIVALGHTPYLNLDSSYFLGLSDDNPIVMDLKGLYSNLNQRFAYWRL
jgi:UDP-N-acetyl-D-galactosamine dehydrogenase